MTAIGSDRAHTPSRRASLGDRALTRVVNPAVRGLLASPLHDLLGEHVALLAVRGRVTGRRIVVPANFEQDGDTLTFTSVRRRLWWRNIVGGAPVEVVLRGARRSGWAEVAQRPGNRVVVRVALEPGEARPERVHGRRLWRRWTAAVTVGETIGFAVPAAAGAALAATGASFGVLAPVVLACGAVEGTALGLSQAYALRQAVPALPTRDWVRATVAGAVGAWVIGLVPFAVELQDVPPPVLAAAGIPLATVLLLSIGTCQWRVLRGRLPRAGWWIPATAGAWAAGLLAFTAVTTPLWQPGQSAYVVAAIGVLGGVVMAATVAATSGAALVRLDARAAGPDPDQAPGSGLRRH